MKHLVKVMKALGDPTRIKILKMLEQRELCVCEIRAALELAQPTVSRHLKTLEEAELVSSRKEGLWVNYRLSEQPATPYARQMLACLRTWLDDDRQIAAIRRRLPEINRQTLCKKTAA